MSLATIIGTAQLIKALSGQPDTAIVQDSAMVQNDPVKTEVLQEAPYKLILESAPATIDKRAVNFQRVKVINDHFGLEYDFKGSNLDVGRISFKEKNIGINLYKKGEWDGNDNFYWEAWKTLQAEKNSFLIDVGAGNGNKTKPLYFILGKMTTPNTMAEAAMFQDGDNFFHPDKSFFGYAGFDYGQAYFGIGKNPNQLVGVAGTKGDKDFGNIAFALYNPKTRSWTIKSQTSFKNANQKIFNKDLFDFVGEYFLDLSMMPKHLGPLNTKGDLTMKLYGNGDRTQTELEAMVGYNNAIIPFAIGANTLEKMGKRNTNFALEIYKAFSMQGLSGYVEARYNARTGDITGYIMTNYELR